MTTLKCPSCKGTRFSFDCEMGELNEDNQDRKRRLNKNGIQLAATICAGCGKKTSGIIYAENELAGLMIITCLEAILDFRQKEQSQN